MTQLARGIGVSSGVAVGRAWLLHAEPLPVVPDPIPPERVDEEIEAFLGACRAAGDDLEQLRSQVHDALGDRYTGILEAQKLVLEDPSLVSDVKRQIRVGRVSARWALKQVVSEFTRKFNAVDDEYLRERGGELADVQRRLQRLLRGESAQEHDAPEGSIVVAHAVGPSDAIVLAGRNIVGLATDVGGRTSHTAILAQALCIPAVLGLHDFSQRVTTGDALVLDGDAGEVILEPSRAQSGDAEKRRAASIAVERETASLTDLPAVTRDGTEVTIRANIEFPSELDRALEIGAHGVGLYRSEFLFLAQAPEIPDDEVHTRIYSEIAERAAPHPAVIRTLDLGGEKYFHDVLGGRESHPALGLRAVRYCLERPEVFRPQIRGVLRAAAHFDNLRVMLPLISTIEEIRQVRRLFEEEAERLDSDGVDVRADLPLGIMIEVPAAAAAADLLASEADFLSIGTNDLIQYALAVDRSNEALTHLYQPLHPGVLRMLESVVGGARAAGIPVALCGEMAADPQAVELLIGLGLRELSVHPRAIGPVRDAVRRLDLEDARRRAEEAKGGVLIN